MYFDSADESEDDESASMFYDGLPNIMQRRSPLVMMPMQNQFSSYPYNKYMANQNQPMYMNGYSMAGYNGERYRMPLGSESMAPSYYQNQRYYDFFSPGTLRTRDQGVFIPNTDKLMKCSVCQSRSSSFDPQAAMMRLWNIPESSDGYEVGEYSRESEGHVKNKLSEDDLNDGQFEGSHQFEEDSPGMEEKDYYNEERNPARLEENAASDIIDVDYSQINPHGIIYKREENKSQKSKGSNKGDEGSLKNENKLKSASRSEVILPAVAPKEGREISKSDSKVHLTQDADAIWDANMQTKELSDVMKDSQRAVEEVQKFQQKLASKPQYNYPGFDWKANNYFRGQKRNLEEGRRNKREDEDEQKNMKTGSDEGGGEYEDEEGKGHNDEEEYYEEAESDGKKMAESRPMRENFNYFHKREAKEGMSLEGDL